MPASTYKAISTFTLSSNTQFVTISNIPQNYTDLVVVIDGVSTAGTYIRASFNNAANVSYTAAINNPSSPYTPGAFKGTGGFTGLAGGSNRNQIFFYFQNYSSNIQNKAYLGQTRQGVGGSYWSNTSGTIATTAPITSITYWGDSGNVMAGSTVSVYGLSGNNLKATGGDIITTDGAFWYHAFKTSGTFTPVSTLSCDVIVVAGGGGGGNGGGGAGGYRKGTSLSISSATTVTVGAGGIGERSGVASTNGSNSIFSTITSTGGGKGNYSLVGNSGGSGGGGAAWGASGSSSTVTGGAGNTPSTSPSQGNNGGAGASGSSTTRGGGGGGGAGAVGGTGGASQGGAGGAGTNADSDWLGVVGLGVSGYLAGGGGGGSNGSPYSIGGLGGGGAGGDSFNAVSGVANTGGGGGGIYGQYPAASGGSGLVIVRYPV